MSHFVRCDRCAAEDAVMGTVSLPPGWQKICGADLCEPCCMLVRDFIRFTTARAAALPVEPITESSTGPASDKLFETEPEEKPDAVHTPTPMPVPEHNPVHDEATAGSASHSNPKQSEQSRELLPDHAASDRNCHDGCDKAVLASPHAPIDTSTEERVRTRAAKRRKKLLSDAQDTPPADKRTSFPRGANENA